MALKFQARNVCRGMLHALPVLLFSLSVRFSVHLDHSSLLFDKSGLHDSLFSPTTSDPIRVTTSPPTRPESGSVLCAFPQPLPSFIFLSNSSNPNDLVSIRPATPFYATLRQLLLSLNYNFTPDPTSAHHILALYDDTTFPNSPLPPALSSALQNRTSLVYVVGSPSHAPFLTCTNTLPLKSSIRAFSIILFGLYLIILFLFVFIQFRWRSLLPIVRLPFLSPLSELLSIGKNALSTLQRIRAIRPLLPNFGVSLSVDFALTDEHLVDFGNSTTYTDHNDVTIHKRIPLLPDDFLDIKLRLTNPESVYTEAGLLNELGRLFSISSFTTLIGDTSREGMQRCVDLLCEIWDLEVLRFFVYRDGASEFMIGHDDSHDSFQFSEDVIGRPTGHVIREGGYQIMIDHTVCGRYRFVLLVAIPERRALIPVLHAYFQRLAVSSLSLSYLLNVEKGISSTFRSYLRMIRASHAFSVIEYPLDSHVPTTEFGLHGERNAEIRERFFRYLPLQSHRDFVQVLRSLRAGEIASASRQYQLEYPDGGRRWFAISIQSSYDETYDGIVLCFLYEDITHLREREAEVQAITADLGLASRLLRLRKFAVTGGKWEVESDLYHELGHQAVGFQEIIHPADLPKLAALKTAETMTLRLKNRIGRAQWHWYKAVCTSSEDGIRGFVFGVNEFAGMRAIVLSTRECFRVGSTANSFAFWAINMTDNDRTHPVFETKPITFLRDLIEPSFL
jgi:hypothetical protein